MMKNINVEVAKILQSKGCKIIIEKVDNVELVLTNPLDIWDWIVEQCYELDVTTGVESASYHLYKPLDDIIPRTGKIRTKPSEALIDGIEDFVNTYLK